MIATLLAAGLLLAPSANAFWRMPCAKPVLNARVDPIVTPGKASSHSHTIMGSNAIGFDTTFESLRSSQCTTCKVKDDLSAYWIPELFYQYKNGSFQAVTHGGAIIYYLQRNAANETVEAFPDGLRMFTGNPYARENQNNSESKAISWLCITDGPAQAQTPGFADTSCTTALRAQVFFPGCWDGVNLDSPDHKSHMAYPDGIDNGQCPYTHPHHLVSLFYEMWFNVKPFNDLNDGGRFVLSNGDATGYGLHGDFMNGWDRDILSQAVAKCTAASGVIEDCPVFANGVSPHGFEDDATMNSCAAKNPLPDEMVDPGVILPNLPGCVAVTKGPGPASPADLVPGCVVGGSGSAPSVAQSPAMSSSTAPSTSSPPPAMSSGNSSTPLPSSAADHASSSSVSGSAPPANQLAATGSSVPGTPSPAASAPSSAGAMGPASSWTSSWTSTWTTSSTNGAMPSQPSSHCARDYRPRDEADSVLAHRRSRMQRRHGSH